MKNNFVEYEEMVVRFNLYVYRWLYLGIPVFVGLTNFIIVYLYDGEFIIDFIVSTIMAIVFYKSLKKTLSKVAKKSNRTEKLVELQTTIQSDYIEEIVMLENGLESTSKYYFKDILKVKEDKYNFYLFIINNSAIIINKQKLENIEVFRKQIKDKCVMIKR